MTALPTQFYRDPLETLIELEEGTCAGCVHEATMLFRGQPFKYCVLPRRLYGKRCKLYEPTAQS